MRGLTAFGRQFVLPNGIILLIAVVVQRLSIFTPSQQNAQMAVFVAGVAALALAWRFNLPRMALALATSVLLMFGAIAASGAQVAIGECALALIAFVAPINIAFLLLIEDANFDLESFGWWAGVLTIEALLIYVMCRSEATDVTRWLRSPVVNTPVLQFLLTPITIVTLMAAGALFINYIATTKAPDAALVWSTLALGLAFGHPRAGEPLYFIAATLIVASGILEGSYTVAYHDELTGLPGRRAYHRMTARLSGNYSIAVVDIDHFKKFNDTYGHDVGDEVLRMVATRLQTVTGGGKAFRLGGEEFAIVHPYGNAENSAEHLDLLREDIELTPFFVRGPDRSKRERPDRRRQHERKRVATKTIDTRVTVSMGVADTENGDDPEEIMLCADRALYEAKEGGRNRVVRYTGFQVEKKRKTSKRGADKVPAISPDRFR